MKKWLLALLPIVILAVSCGKDGKDTPTPEDTPSSACTLNSFQFAPSSNPGVVTTTSAVIATIREKKFILITVPEGVNTTSLVPTFIASSKSRIFPLHEYASALQNLFPARHRSTLQIP